MTTNNPHFGPTRNPWDRSRIPGGSSGGSAAAVVARLATGALGTDTGGSVRIPASLCGCVGLKPTFGLVPTTGVIALSYLADHVGPIARTVEDAALLLQAIAGYDPADPATLPIPVPDYAGGLGGDLRGLRIGVPRATAWTLLDDDVARAAEAALVVLGELGADLVDVDLPDPIAALGGPGSIGFFGVAVEESRQAHRDAWDARPEDFGPDLTMLYSAPPLTGAMVIDTLAIIRTYAAAIRSALIGVDLLASPTVPVPAPPIGADVVEIDGLELPFIAVAIANTAPYNMARLPAISVPCGFTTDQLPVGLQLAGRPLDEPNVLRAAHAYEQATDWTRRPPPQLREPT
jgi:aspartyl-tRNA(Asn)/glutamyl-tRNA(Gln) amidotransferase subunit A